jgi:hypothetical protein
MDEHSTDNPIVSPEEAKAKETESCARCGRSLNGEGFDLCTLVEDGPTRPCCRICYATAMGWTGPDHVLQAPTPLEDIERRLKALRESGVRAYKDGPLEIIFSGQQRQAGSPMDEALRQFHDLEARAREAASGKAE